MRKLVIPILAAVVLVGLVPASATAQESPVNLALFKPVQITSEETSVTLLRLSLIYGVNWHVTGLDVGVVARTRGDGRGMALDLVGLVDGNFTGWPWGVVSSVKGSVNGFQSGGLNQAEYVRGFQWGLVNVARDVGGFQLGLVNITDRMEGIQLGLINVIKSKSSLRFLPIVNWSF